MPLAGLLHLIMICLEIGLSPEDDKQEHVAVCSLCSN